MTTGRPNPDQTKVIISGIGVAMLAAALLLGGRWFDADVQARPAPVSPARS